MGPQSKRRKLSTKTEEITFDSAARHEFLTGFHKRKLQRTRHAQEIAEKKAREERREERKRIREERMAEYQRAFVEHQEQLKRLTEGDSSNSDNGNSSDSESESHGDEEWEGFAEPPAVDYEAEYIDEDKYTTVTVEAMDASKEALYRLQRDDDSDEEEDGQKGQSLEAVASSNGSSGKKKKTTNPDKVKKKKKQFRYESKEERKLALAKQRLAKKRKANARRER